MLENIIKDYLRTKADEHKVTLTPQELHDAFKGVEYAVSECMADAVSDAFFNVYHDRFRGDDNDN